MNIQRKLLVIGGSGPVVFAVIFLVVGAFRNGYNAWHDTISVLSLGEYGWTQAAGFAIYGVLTVVLAVGLVRTGEIRLVAAILLLIAALGLLILSAVPTDPVLGFPAGESSTPTERGDIHSLTALVVFVCIPASALANMRRGWILVPLSTAIASLVAVGLFFVAVGAAAGGVGGDSPAGLLERLPVLFMGVWEVLSARRALTRPARTDQEASPVASS
jgi:hypothetical protein